MPYQGRGMVQAVQIPALEYCSTLQYVYVWMACVPEATFPMNSHRLIPQPSDDIPGNSSCYTGHELCSIMQERKSITWKPLCVCLERHHMQTYTRVTG